MLNLRPYQEECVNRIVEAYEENRSGYEIIVLPTGTGKTVVFSTIIAELQKKHKVRSLILAHRDKLLSQADSKLKNVNPDITTGKIGAGTYEYEEEATLASIQTVCKVKHIKKMQEAGGYHVIVVDEAHHMTSRSYQKVIEAFPDAFVLGVTATPERLDNRDICKGKKPIYEANIVDMVKEGWLCDIRAIAVQTDISLNRVSRSMGDFNEKELDNAVNIPARNALIVQKYLEYTPGKRAICFGVTVDHAVALADAFDQEGVPSAIITGETSIEERDAIYEDFHDGRVLVLCSVMVCTEGYDEPRVEVVIPARPTQSKGLFKQMIGRGLRLSEGKTECVILDITDNCSKHKLSPYNLKQAIDVEGMRKGESLLGTLAREEKEIQVRKLKERRIADEPINIFNRLEWKVNEYGVSYMEVGREKHKFALIASKKTPNMYYVGVKFSYDPGNLQTLTTVPSSFGEAKAFAERKASTILSDPNERTGLVDMQAEWRKHPATAKQLKLLSLYNIPHNENTTGGQAAALIDNYYIAKGNRRFA